MSGVQVQVQAERKFKNMEARLSIRTNCVLPPFDTTDLIESLAGAGYARATPATPPRPHRGIRFTFAGPIARKGAVIIDVNDERGILGATSPIPALATQGLNEVLQTVKAKLKVDLESMAMFYEFIGNLEVETQPNPLERIGQISDKVKAFEAFGRIIGEEVSLFSLRLTPKNKVPNQTEWFDITIEPDPIQTASKYAISAVYRSGDKHKVEKFAEEFLPKITGILNAIENP
jgi:hypothetical protein